MGIDNILYYASRLAAECLCLVIVLTIYLHLCDLTRGAALHAIGICLSSFSPYVEGHGTRCDATLRCRE